MRWQWKLLGVAVATALLNIALAPSARALYLDEQRLFKITGTFYTQTRLRVQDSDAPLDLRGGGSRPDVKIGQLIQWRNFGFPVLEGDLTKSLGLGFFHNLSFRFGGRFIYDGVYDVGAGQFGKALRRHIVSAKSTAPNPLDQNPGPGLGGNVPVAIYRGTEPVETNTMELGPCGSQPPFFSPICQIADADMRARRLADQEILNSRELFAQQFDPWEIYLNFEKRPLFLRIGRQSLAWGESDGQRLLDGINPLDRLFGLPFDEDIDEQRIPLWMIRGNLQLIDSLGPLSSFGLESFFVPGVIDTTVGPIPLGANYPYAPPAGCDPQFIANEEAIANFGGSRPAQEGCTQSSSNPGTPPRGTIKTSLYERLPEKKWHNSRWGARVVGILFRDFTFSFGFYHSLADIPQPRVHYTDLLLADAAQPPDQNQANPPLPSATIAELTHDHVDVIGGTLSFFQPYLLPGVLRTEVGYFMDEPALVPIANFGNVPLLPDFLANSSPSRGVFLDTFVPDADYLRWVIGYDIYQLNVPWISPTNNIIVVSQFFNSYRLTSNDAYQAILEERGLVGNACDGPCSALGRFDFGNAAPDGSRISLSRYSALGNITFQAFMMHGLLVPRLTFVGDIEGWGAALPSVEYRLRDDLLVRLSYSAIFGKFFGGGIFRDRDQVGARITWLLS